VAVGVQAEQRLHHARQAGGRQHQPAHRRVAVAALQHHERQQGRHQALVEVVDGMGAREQPESALVHSIAFWMSIEKAIVGSRREDVLATNQHLSSRNGQTEPAPRRRRTTPRAVAVLATDPAGDAFIPLHTHRRGQLIHAISG
jgi:hypothetical protein